MVKVERKEVKRVRMGDTRDERKELVKEEKIGVIGKVHPWVAESEEKYRIPGMVLIEKKQLKQVLVHLN